MTVQIELSLTSTEVTLSLGVYTHTHKNTSHIETDWRAHEALGCIETPSNPTHQSKRKR